jgi:large repetitive protein
VKVADASPAPDTKQLVIRVVDPLVINGFGARDRVAEVGRAYSATLKGSGGTSPYKWVLSGTLPTGFSFDPATGVLSGTPTAPGRIPVKISMEDANGLVQLVDGTLNIVSHVQITSKALAAGAVGRLYSATLRVSGGVRPLTWKVISGKVPTGFRLNARTGLLTGTPRAGGTFRFRVRVTDAVGATWTKPLVLTVR